MNEDVRVIIQTPAFLTANTPILSNAQATPTPVDVTAETLTLQANLAATPPLPDVCGIHLGHDASSFVVAGRGGTPAQPGGQMPDFCIDDLRLTSSSAKSPASVPGVSTH